MRTQLVRAGAEAYEAIVGEELFDRLGSLVRAKISGTRGAVISDTNVAPLYADSVLESLRAADCVVHLVTIPAGERSKSFDHAGELCAQLSALGLDRSSFLVSLGGGVVGDLTGFVASVFLRGIPYISLPTTLLAQVDSCIGGKTGVNSAAGKNLIGTFHHPALVLADTATLRTLPEHIWNEGFAEAIKHGVIRDAALFEFVPEVTRENTEEFVARNIALKASIVAADERERSGVRALLNFGHTIGHALEHAAGYGKFLHGEAISLGMVAAARISTRRAGLSSGDCARIVGALAARQLPTRLPEDFPRERIFESLQRDKKFEQGQIRFVVAHAIGHASVSEEVTPDDLQRAIAEL